MCGVSGEDPFFRGFDVDYFSLPITISMGGGDVDAMSFRVETGEPAEGDFGVSGYMQLISFKVPFINREVM